MSAPQRHLEPEIDEAMARYGRLSVVHWTIFGLSVCATILAWLYASQLEDQRIQANFAASVRQVSTLLEESLEHYEVALRSGVAAIEAQNGTYSFEEWSQFASSLEIERTLPGVNGIGVIYQVQPEDLDAFLAAQRVTRPEFDIHPPHGQDIYQPITYIYPVDINIEAVGLDMVFEANRHMALNQARDTGTPQITGPIRLVQDELQTPGFLFYAPIYQGPLSDDTSGRQAAFQGAVYAPFITKDLISGALSLGNRTSLIRITDQGEVIYDEMNGDNSDFDPDAMAQTRFDLDLYGRVWSVDLQSGLAFRAQQRSYRPETVLSVGVIIDFFLLILFLVLLRENRMGVRFARTLQRDAERQAAQSLETSGHLRAVMDAAQSGIIAMDGNGQIVFLNAAARTMLACTDTPVPFAWPDSFGFIGPDDLSPAESPIERAIAGEALNNVVMGVAVQSETTPRRFVRLSSAVVSGASPFSAQTVLIMDDVTEQEINRQKIERSGRLDALGQLTGGIAHDFNNLLGIIEYSVELASTAKDPDKQAMYKKSALTSVRRGSDLANRLLTFAKKQPGETSAIHVDRFCADFEALIEPTIDKFITVEFDVEPDLWVNCNAPQLENALLNLLLNARDAIAKSGQGNKVLVRVRAAQRALHNSDAEARLTNESTPCVEISVTDNGPGMDAETRSRSTDPFFTTKDTLSGSGLGLSMVYGFVEQSGGDLTIYSEQGVGTTVRMLLPEGDGSGATDDGGAEVPLPMGTGETVLITEDEPDLLFLMANLLDSLGYVALQARTWDEALAILKSSQPIDLLLTDVVMPGGIGGFQLAKTARELRGNLPILYMSGYSGFSQSEMGDVVAPIVNKPSSPHELAHALKDALSLRTSA